MILRYLFRNLCSISIFELEAPQLDAISSDRFKDCLVQQQLIFDSCLEDIRYRPNYPLIIHRINRRTRTPFIF